MSAAEGACHTGGMRSIVKRIAAVCATAGTVALLMGAPGLIGFIYGAAITLVIWRGVQIVVRACLRAEAPLRKAVLAVLLVLKFPVLVLLPAGAAWLILHRMADPFALIGGIAAVQGVILIRALDARVLAAMPQETVEALLGGPLPAVKPLTRPLPQSPPVPEGSGGSFSLRLAPPSLPVQSQRRAESR